MIFTDTIVETCNILLYTMFTLHNEYGYGHDSNLYHWRIFFQLVMSSEIVILTIQNLVEKVLLTMIKEGEIATDTKRLPVPGYTLPGSIKIYFFNRNNKMEHKTIDLYLYTMTHVST